MFRLIIYMEPRRKELPDLWPDSSPAVEAIIVNHVVPENKIVRQKGTISHLKYVGHTELSNQFVYAAKVFAIIMEIYINSSLCGVIFENLMKLLQNLGPILDF